MEKESKTYWQKHSNCLVNFIVYHFNLIYSKPFYYLPRIIKPGAGYGGKDKGIAISWMGLMYHIRRPINERFVNL